MRKLLLCIAVVLCGTVLLQAAQEEPEQLEITVLTTEKENERSGSFYVEAFLYRASRTIEVLMDDSGETDFRIYDAQGQEWEFIREYISGYRRVRLVMPDNPGRYCLWISSTSAIAIAYFMCAGVGSYTSK